MKALQLGPAKRPLDRDMIYENTSYWLIEYREMKEMEKIVPDRQDLDTELRVRMKVRYEQKKRGFEPPSPMELFSP